MPIMGSIDCDITKPMQLNCIVSNDQPESFIHYFLMNYWNPILAHRFDGFVTYFAFITKFQGRLCRTVHILVSWQCLVAASHISSAMISRHASILLCPKQLKIEKKEIKTILIKMKISTLIIVLCLYCQISLRTFYLVYGLSTITVGCFHSIRKKLQLKKWNAPWPMYISDWQWNEIQNKCTAYYLLVY